MWPALLLRNLNPRRFLGRMLPHLLQPEPRVPESRVQSRFELGKTRFLNAVRSGFLLEPVSSD